MEGLQRSFTAQMQDERDRGYTLAQHRHLKGGKTKETNMLASLLRARYVTTTNAAIMARWGCSSPNFDLGDGNENRLQNAE